MKGNHSNRCIPGHLLGPAGASLQLSRLLIAWRVMAVCPNQARAAAWLPELPPRASAPVSPYIAEILTFLEASFSFYNVWLTRCCGLMS